MKTKNDYTALVEASQKTIESYGHEITVPAKFIDPITGKIIEFPVELSGTEVRFDLKVLLNYWSGEINRISEEDKLLNPLTHEPVNFCHLDKKLRREIEMFVKGICMLASAFKAKNSVRS